MADDESRDTLGIVEENAACRTCRQRKLKCSREIPSCSQCRRLSCQCVYDQKKQKPGIKSGVIEGLSRRIEALEQNIAAFQQGSPTSSRPGPRDTPGCVYHAALFVSDSISKMHGSDCDSSSERPHCVSCDSRLSSNKRPCSAVDPATETFSRRQVMLSYPFSTASRLISNPYVLKIVIENYFSNIHPWIPCVHQPRFEQRLKDSSEGPELQVLINAMISSTVKHLSAAELNINSDELASLENTARDQAMHSAMGSLSVENMQALIIMSFDHIGTGRVSSAWPIVGCLSRAAEYLRLNLESDEVTRQALVPPLNLLQSTQNWAEEEERRRVFWNVFLLDRFCAVSTRWSTSLTSSDVRRRLPCDGKIWARGDKAITSHFGVWDKTFASIDNSIAHIPLQRSQPSQITPPKQGESIAMAGIDPANVGAFAYRIEATESLCQVSSFFLQQPVDFSSRQEVTNWLTRFKELDLRLVHWKHFLPPKWKDSNVSTDGETVNMDPNLTLAHLTHNTSTILLHQYIAYPPPDLIQLVQVPSSCSVETCQLAAIESASISAKYLQYAPSNLLPGQFGFCLFIAARNLLLHWRVFGGGLLSEFGVLVQALQSMSRGWQRKEFVPNGLASLADKYISLLLFMKSNIQDDPSYSIHSLLQHDIKMESETLQHESFMQACNTLWQESNAATAIHPQTSLRPPSQLDLADYETIRTQANQHLHRSDLTRQSFLDDGHGTPFNDCPHDELAVMSSSLLEQQFLDLDRVITWEGTDFTMDKEYWASQLGTDL